MNQSSGYALTIIRVVLGIIFLVHGVHKIFGWDTGALGPGGLSNTVTGMGQMGMPAIMVYLLAFGELLGGLGLLLGLLSRIAAGGILIIMLGAVFMVHLPHGFFINWSAAEGVHHGYEYNLALIAMAISIIWGGPGCLAIDNKCCKKSV